jgi:uncharacterized protein (TIGR02596 family)
MKTRRPTFRSAFSLIELIVVITIIGVIAAFTIPAASSILRGSAITQASQMITDQISLARQFALSRNRAIEVRFYQFADPEVPGETLTNPSTGEYRALQIFEVLDSGAVVPLDKPQRLPNTVMFNASKDFSTLLYWDTTGTKAATPQSATTKDPEMPRGVTRNYKYVAFRFLQDGSTNLSASLAGGWFVTVHNITDKAQITGTKPPPNFYTLQVDPISGSVKGFRPTAG